MSGKKLNILCLHGFRTSGKILEWQAKPLIKATEGFVNYAFIDSPMKSRGEPDADVSMFFQPPYYEWANCDDKTNHYDRLFENIQFIEQQAMSKFYAQVDGILGFSQGAMMGALLCEKKAKENHILWKRLKFFISFSGYKCRDPRVQKMYADPPMDIPSFHVFGEKDERFRTRSEDLLKIFSPTLRKSHMHSEGHMFPMAKEHQVVYTDIADWLQQFREKPVGSR